MDSLKILFNEQLLSLVIFVASYLLFIFLPKKRSLTAILAAVLLVSTQVVSPKEAVLSVNWNVMGIFVGTLFVADIFMKSRVPAYLAELIVNRAKNTAWSILLICVMTGVISAFVENVATVLIVAPVALALASKLHLNPTKMMIAIAVSSNLQGAATLIGDPPSMILGGFARMNFGDFFFYKSRPSIFFAVELGALSSFLIFYLLFRHHRGKEKIIPVEKVKSWVPTYLLIALILSLASSSFFDTGFSYMAGMICMVFGMICVFLERIMNKSMFLKSLKHLDWDTTFFLMGIFILVGSITETGWIDKISIFLSNSIGQNIFLAYSILLLIAMVLSAFIDNVPLLAALLPVAVSMSEKLQINPSLFLFGLLIGASLGGNITPIGASANIVACGLLKKEGYPVRFRDFVRIGLPFTLAAVSSAYLFIWIVWR